MPTEHPRKIFDALDAILDRECTALKDGNLEAIPSLLKEKEALFDRLQSLDHAARGELDALQSKVAHNQALVDGALHGIRTVADRLGNLRRVHSSLETYDSAGRRTSVPNNSQRHVEKRA
ncbi:FlgN protein [Salinihabitans flavidus]|uniref:FlgN protein n=1 Tax=Salinihabitans flavidus TaxID=569882 RepID=A0A1H8LPS0_9RHOB|nr:flagellar export chaperone FlgN [Salinihabitans flavidus]SEO07043.1 FlgN protein [Salinihabitans flavidus]